MRIKAEDTFAIVIDYQGRILPAMSGQEETAPQEPDLTGRLEGTGSPDDPYHTVCQGTGQ